MTHHSWASTSFRLRAQLSVGQLIFFSGLVRSGCPRGRLGRAGRHDGRRSLFCFPLRLASWPNIAQKPTRKENDRMIPCIFSILRNKTNQQASRNARPWCLLVYASVPACRGHSTQSRVVRCHQPTALSRFWISQFSNSEFLPNFVFGFLFLLILERHFVGEARATRISSRRPGRREEHSRWLRHWALEKPKLTIRCRSPECNGSTNYAP